MRHFTWIICLMVLIGCKKSEDRTCWKSVGDEATLEIPLDPFNQMYMGPHIAYEMIQSNEEKVVITGGKNLINFIETSIESGKLTIKNNNKCNWLRSYDKIVHVTIYFKDVVNIEFEGTSPVTCPEALNLNNLVVAIKDGAGQFNMTLNAISLRTSVTHGWGNFNIAGTVSYLNLKVGGNGFGNVNKLNVSDSMTVISNTTEVVKINANNCALRAQTFESGDIWYIGNPTFVEYNAYSTGQLIDKN